MDRRRFTAGLCACSAALLAAADARAAASLEFVTPHYQPAPDSDERGLWAAVERTEREVKASRFTLRDPSLTSYVQEILCRLGRDHCQDVRSYVIRTPLFNASMAPNGMLQVWSGLLLRCRDEAQLAAIVGHELGHYLRRHTVQQWRDARTKADFGAFLSLGLAAAGVGVLGSVTNLALVASVFAFSRDQEREADEIGLALMADAGYAPGAAAEVWEQLLTEQRASTAEGSKSTFFATHPDSAERLAALQALAAARAGGAEERGLERYRERLRSIRPMLVADELRLRQYGRSETVFDGLLARSGDDGLLWYAKGEIYRLRGDAGDLDRALAAYERARNAEAAPPELYRSIAMTAHRLNDRARAEQAFARYAELSPAASDLETLRNLLAQ